MEILHQVTFLQALMVAIFAGLAGIDLFNVLTHIHRPIIAGPIVGILMGDPQAGLVAGASFELMWMGLVPLAGAQPPNVVMGGIIGTAFVIATGKSAQEAIAVAIPFAIFVQVCITFLFTAFSPLMKKADHYADTLNFGGIASLNYLGMAGGLMPAIGFGILLNIMLRKEYVAYFILGFVLVAYLNQPLLAIALIGTAFALIEYFIRDSQPAKTSAPQEEGI